MAAVRLFNLIEIPLTSRLVTWGEGCKQQRQNSVCPIYPPTRKQASVKSQLEPSALPSAANWKTASHKLSVPKMA